MKDNLRVLISGGGTGGHIFPALSIANEIKIRFPQAEILFVGAESRMEMEKVPAAGYKIVGLPVYGFDRRNILRNFKVLWNLGKSITMVMIFSPDSQTPDNSLTRHLPHPLCRVQSVAIPLFMRRRKSERISLFLTSMIIMV